MRCSKMLLKIIGEDNSYAKIANKCAKIGISVDKSYISKLATDKIKAPSEDILRAIAKVCGKDERLLVIESALDRAPKEIFDAFNSLRLGLTIASEQYFSNITSEDTLNELKQYLEDEPISELIIGLIDGDAKNYDYTNTGFGFEVTDKSMEPLIMKGTKVQLEIKEQYEDGNIVMVCKNSSKERFVGTLILKEEMSILTFINKDIKIKSFKNSDIQIMGRVSRIITEI